MPPSFPEGPGFEAVEERLTELENAGYFPEGSLDDRVLEPSAHGHMRFNLAASCASVALC